MPFKSVQDYSGHLRSVLSVRGFPAEIHKVKLFPISKRKRDEGLIRAANIALQDRAKLWFEVTVEIEAGIARILKFPYGFQNSKISFRYEKDPKRARGLAYHECYLHVSGHDNIRYPIH